jgi:hypothetical protein
MYKLPVAAATREFEFVYKSEHVVLSPFQFLGYHNILVEKQ